MSRGDFGNLILTGFMGTGKTTIGKAVAQSLNRPFVDMDTEIETRTGKPIPQIFAEDGEAAFRRIEATFCEELSQSRGLVIATGGGALVNPTNRTLMMESGTVVCLTCEVHEIMRRVNLGADGDRPLLDVADPRTEIDHLLGMRHEAYAAIPWWIDTTRRSVEQVTQQVIALAGVNTLPVHHPGGQYPIHIGTGLLNYAGGVIRAAGVPSGGRIAVVSNPVVAPLYVERVISALETAEFRPFLCLIPDGEQHKTLATVSSLFEQFLNGELDRSGTVLSLGGGVTGDVAGFAAATYMRGVRFAQLPTTLLSMVDASVGGKTGVDLPQGKNLVGAFKQPALVVIDPSVLATLSPQETRSGLAEVIKHGVIGNPSLFEALESGNGESALWWGNLGPSRIARALRVKIDVVEGDPFERGRRAVLNLGHTIGHALEKLSRFELRHGEAIAVGMVGAAHISAKLERADATLADRIASALKAWGLPTACPPFTIGEIWEAMSHDKKRQGRGLRWVLPHAIGQVEIAENVSPHIVKSVLKDLGARSDS